MVNLAFVNPRTTSTKEKFKHSIPTVCADWLCKFRRFAGDVAKGQFGDFWLSFTASFVRREMAPRRAASTSAEAATPSNAVPVDRLGKVRAPNTKKGSLEVAELLPFQRNLLQQLVPPDDALPNANDAMVVMARGLGLRTVVTTFVSRADDVGVYSPCEADKGGLQLKIYDIPEKLVLLVNATPEEERGFAEEVGMRLKVVAHEMPESQR